MFLGILLLLNAPLSPAQIDKQLRADVLETGYVHRPLPVREDKAFETFASLKPAVTSQILCDMESLEGWRKRRETEGITSQSIRISTVRQLSLYMNSIGIESFVPTDKYVKTHPAIHILSLSEISELFQIIDSWHPKRPCQETSRMAEEYRVLFRLILSTGLRRQEAVEIRISDIEWDSMSITVRGAKGRKDRLVYMAEDMSALVRTYMQYICRVTGYIPEWLFPSIDINEHVSGGGRPI